VGGGVEDAGVRPTAVSYRASGGKRGRASAIRGGALAPSLFAPSPAAAAAAGAWCGGGSALPALSQGGALEGAALSQGAPWARSALLSASGERSELLGAPSAASFFRPSPTGTQPSPGAPAESPWGARSRASASAAPAPAPAPAPSAPPPTDSPLGLAELSGGAQGPPQKRGRRSSLRRRGAPPRHLRVSLPPEYLTSPEAEAEEGAMEGRGGGAPPARSAPRRRPLQVMSQVPASTQRGAKAPANVLAAGKKKGGGGIAGWLKGRR
jgi:hypothetical protein